ncbi:ABC transporter permease [Demequina rhizosphaerae]|uniref:ABC transporter permease n=1 Tax=Demequina rhizosphaerae TaxID=1638985 RepID=UPI0009E63B11|nr:FtsX-like permease family protein [Demequina rhizosphaerae]
MRVTTRKSLRDLRRSRAQVVAVAVTILLGVMIFVATAGAFENLTASYHHTYERLALPTYIATGGDVAAVASAADDAGAATTGTRAQYDPPMLIEDTKLLGRVVGMPTGNQPELGAIDVTVGAYLGAGATDEAVIETHAASTFDISPGDTLQIYAADGWHEVTVVGVAVSAEYIWPARSRQDAVSDPHSFAVLYLPEDTVNAWFGPDNQALVAMPDRLTASSDNAVTRAMDDAGATAIQAWEDMPSQATLNEDLDGFDEMSKAFPALFLTAAGVASYVMLSRRILMERPIIATLMAGGARRGRVLRMYLLQGLMIGTLGGVVGVLLGALANGAVTSAYTSALGVPDTIVENYPWMIASGVVFGALVGLLGALFPALAASRTEPAAAMHAAAPLRPPGPWGRLVARLRWMPVPARMALRDIGRSPRRTIATMLGAVLSMVLVLASVGIMTTMVHALETQYDVIDNQDASVAVSGGTDAATLETVDGVEAVEATVVGQVTARADGTGYATVLRGFRTDTEMHTFLLEDGTTTTLPASGILAGVGLADVLDVEVGDQLTLVTEAGDTTVTLEGLLAEPMGTYLYAAEDVAQGMLPDSQVATYDLIFADGADRDTMREDITALDGVVAYEDSKALLTTVQQYLGLFWAFIGVMIALGGVLALAVMYVTLAVNVVERTGELATLRAAGVPVRKVAGTISTENVVATALGLPFGLAAGTIAAAGFLSTFSSDLFTFDLWWSWWVPWLAAAGVLVASALSRIPAARAVRRVDVARVVRERAV